MAYSTVTDIKNALPATVVQQLSDDNDTDQIDPEKVNYCIAQADDLLDGYLRGRYTVPLATVPNMIRDLSVRLTIYFLFKRSLYSVLPDAIKDDYTYVTKVMIGIQQGKINPFEATDEPSFFATNKTQGDRIFTSTPIYPNVTPSMTGPTRSGKMNWSQYPI